VNGAKAERALTVGRMTDAELSAELARYSFYHEIEVRPGVKTVPKDQFSPLWGFIKERLLNVDFRGKRVLDVGCRDGLFSLFAERGGASFVKGIDNDLSHGAVDVVLPAMASNVIMEEENLLHFIDEPYDIVMCFGVLYHLRFPMAGLAALLHLTKPGGKLLIETGVLARLTSADRLMSISGVPLLYCPFVPNPYEQTSVSFFNRAGLIATLTSLGAKMDHFVYGPLEMKNTCAHPPEDGLPPVQVAEVRRAFAYCTKLDSGSSDDLRRYWTSTHNSHTKVK
jgi:2-polyprenyl-3-methyl-5-hydroxy-6-metoxy-1,4-benzoquinol methylase